MFRAEAQRTQSIGGSEREPRVPQSSPSPQRKLGYPCLSRVPATGIPQLSLG